ncbi:hypothetical protein NL676_003173 [Syzygium grande]|nr:hypothetical protein NL676_003173 [Syzygium grande]
MMGSVRGGRTRRTGGEGEIRAVREGSFVRAGAARGDGGGGGGPHQKSTPCDSRGARRTKRKGTGTEGSDGII